jgi:hypothetical protein
VFRVLNLLSFLLQAETRWSREFGVMTGAENKYFKPEEGSIHDESQKVSIRVKQNLSIDNFRFICEISFISPRHKLFNTSPSKHR